MIIMREKIVNQKEVQRGSGGRRQIVMGCGYALTVLSKDCVPTSKLYGTLGLFVQIRLL